MQCFTFDSRFKVKYSVLIYNNLKLIIQFHMFKFVRASPLVPSMRLQRVKFTVKNSKCVGLVQEISFSAPNSCCLPWLVKGGTHFCTSKDECNKLDLTEAQYF
jgi:hypothetical protein